MSGYTPTAEEARNAWVCCIFDSGGAWVSGAAYEDAQWDEERAEAQFDRWLEGERYRVRSEVARDIEVMASQGILNSDFRAGMLYAATIVRGETGGS